MSNFTQCIDNYISPSAFNQRGLWFVQHAFFYLCKFFIEQFQKLRHFLDFYSKFYAILCIALNPRSGDSLGAILGVRSVALLHPRKYGRIMQPICKIFALKSKLLCKILANVHYFLYLCTAKVRLWQKHCT